MSNERFLRFALPHRIPEHASRERRSPHAAALTRFAPSDIVTASPFASRHTAPIAHALPAAPLAPTSAAFNSQARSLAP